jgi:nitroreductase
MPVTPTTPPAEFGDPLPLEPAPEVLRFLSRRRSTSAVTLTEPGPSRAQLDQLLALATRVPDHGKLSPWRLVVLQGDAKTRFAERLETIANGRNDARAAGKLAKLKLPPLAVAVISSPDAASPIPEWEQVLSAGAVCTTLLYAALAMGYGANWITDWYAYDAQAISVLGLRPGERVAGFVLLGTPKEPPRERERPQAAALVETWSG